MIMQNPKRNHRLNCRSSNREGLERIFRNAANTVSTAREGVGLRIFRHLNGLVLVIGMCALLDCFVKMQVMLQD